MILFVACGLLIGIVAYATHSKTGINYFVPKFLLASLSLALLATVSAADEAQLAVFRGSVRRLL